MLIKTLIYLLFYLVMKLVNPYLITVSITIKDNVIFISALGYIPMILQYARFRMPVRFMTETHLFIKGYSLKKRCNEEHYLLRHRRRAGLETLYATLYISISEQPLSSIHALPKDVSNTSLILHIEVTWVYNSKSLTALVFIFIDKV